MMQRILPIFICYVLLLAGPLAAQDSLPKVAADSGTGGGTPPASQLQPVAPVWVPVDFTKTGYYKLLQSHPYLNFSAKGVYRTIQPKTVRGKEGVFYLLLGLLFLLALIKVSFGRYLENMFKVFFRASLKAKQIREQLLQTPLASLLLNAHFVAAAGLLATFILQERQVGADNPGFWELYLYSVGAIALIYLGKNFLLKFLGWSLRMTDTIDTYVFIVFLCNKVLGIFLLPLLLLMAFAGEPLATIAQTVSYVLVGVIFLYRYTSAYGFITRELRASRFHFFLYLCAFEVAPLLLIYKVLTKLV
ncbi:DUF4271 domain-containing protein [Flavihumibacter sp. CACIAM 22H1]|uniref:DUF4271 domain-containing protein n=1 Tax=Flavihumibacter sp. CACIAM 22H1 TaxID=1812911 RepID=UPI0007A905BC|nr:DUF4271 domain-containing protein [Flavihumibacter sp. CACIAM 22H1]KYP15300.1 MAG: hypothetical protein A1D16_11125 [Flavihumibacter sp. CACIAM 22H1]